MPSIGLGRTPLANLIHWRDKPDETKWRFELTDVESEIVLVSALRWYYLDRTILIYLLINQYLC